MMGRPPTLIGAAVMLLLIGISGLAAAADFLGLPGRSDLGADVVGAGVGMGLLIGAYSAAATVAGIGVIGLQRWAWWLGVATIASSTWGSAIIASKSPYARQAKASTASLQRAGSPSATATTRKSDGSSRSVFAWMSHPLRPSPAMATLIGDMTITSRRP